jgi:hypothetical protein
MLQYNPSPTTAPHNFNALAELGYNLVAETRNVLHSHPLSTMNAEL